MTSVLVLPGLDGQGILSEAFCSALPDGIDTHAISFPNELTSYDAIADWLEPQIAGRSVVLVAQSFSGPLAIELAKRCPASVERIAFIATFARSPMPFWGRFAALVGLLPVKALARSALARIVMTGRWSTSAFTTQFYQSLSGVPSHTLIGRIQAVAKVDKREILQKLTIPHIYLQPQHDRLVSKAAARDFAGCCDVLKLDGPHFILQERAQVAAEMIAPFLSGGGDG